MWVKMWCQSRLPKRVKDLSATEVKRLAKKQGRHAVGGVPGLNLVVGEASCSWIYRTVIGGRRRDLGVGSYPAVGVGEAREKAREIRRQSEQGVDPLAAKIAARTALKLEEAKRLTFSEATKRAHHSRQHEFKSVRHANNWLRSLELYALPNLGDLPISTLETPHVVRVLEPIWLTKTDTARRVRQRLETVFSWAKVAGFYDEENPARWKGHLDQLLPNPSKVVKVEHHAALPWQDVPKFMQAVRAREGIGARALEYVILTAARSGEVRLAPWEEVDFDNRLWTIPAERMKADRAHRVPLSSQAVRVLKQQSNNLPYLFTSSRMKPLSDMTISAVTKRMAVDAVPHGFRSTFKDWCRANTTYADEISELALAHVNSDATRAAYARDDLLEVRRQLMDEWGEYCGA